MSSTSHTTPEVALDLPAKERWIVHHILTDYAKVALRDDTDLPAPVVEIALIDKIEAGEFEFTAFELDRLRRACAFHAASEYTAVRDREPTEAIVRKIDELCRTAIPC